jgi:acetyl-CoA carboxylase biotin carboxyl carrier protein
MAKKTKQAASPLSGRGVDLAEVERLLDFMEAHHLEQFEYERDGFRVLLKKASALLPVPSPPDSRRPVLAEHPSAEAAMAAAVASAYSPSSTGVRSAAEKMEDLHVIKSPIVGTFYWAASPGAEPFVTVGAGVEPGQVLCIIEAMKLMNEIESDVAGEVAKIFPDNGSPVEYGQPLFGIRLNRKN